MVIPVDPRAGASEAAERASGAKWGDLARIALTCPLSGLLALFVGRLIVKGLIEWPG